MAITNEQLAEDHLVIDDKIDEVLTILQDGYIPTGDEPHPPPVDLGLPIAIMRKKAPLMEVSHYDSKGKPVLRLHKYGVTKLGRIRAKKGKELQYLDILPTAQGKALRLYSGQEVDGWWLTESNSKKKHPVTRRADKYFYILKRLVKV